MKLASFFLIAACAIATAASAGGPCSGKKGGCHRSSARTYAYTPPAVVAPQVDPPTCSGRVAVDGYYRKDGTYVSPHTRSGPGCGAIDPGGISVRTAPRTDVRTTARSSVWMGTGSAPDPPDVLAPPPDYQLSRTVADPQFIVHLVSGRRIPVVAFELAGSSYRLTSLTGAKMTYPKSLVDRVESIAGETTSQLDANSISDEDVRRLLQQLSDSRSDASRREVIDRLRDEQGKAYSEGLAIAIRITTGSVQQYARESLVTRFRALAPPVLKGKLISTDEETQLAAAIAASSGSEELTLALIELLMKEEPINQAARQSLKILTSQDFGPMPGATVAERFAAKQRWERWAGSQ